MTELYDLPLSTALVGLTLVFLGAATLGVLLTWAWAPAAQEEEDSPKKILRIRAETDWIDAEAGAQDAAGRQRANTDQVAPILKDRSRGSRVSSRSVTFKPPSENNTDEGQSGLPKQPSVSKQTSLSSAASRAELPKQPSYISSAAQSEVFDVFGNDRPDVSAFLESFQDQLSARPASEA